MGEHILEQLHNPDDGSLLWQASSTVSEFSSSPSGNADLLAKIVAMSRLNPMIVARF